MKIQKLSDGPPYEMYLYLEYCPGPFYWGWWLYATPVVDGQPQRDHIFRTWLGNHWLRQNRLLEGLKVDPATLDNFRQKYPQGATFFVTQDLNRQWCNDITFPPRQSDYPLWYYDRIIREAQWLDWRKMIEKRRLKKNDQ